MAGSGARAGGSPGAHPRAHSAHPRAHSAPCAPPGCSPPPEPQQITEKSACSGCGVPCPALPAGTPGCSPPAQPGPARPLPGSPRSLPGPALPAFVWEAARPGHGRLLPARRPTFPKSFFLPEERCWRGLGAGRRGPRCSPMTRQRQSRQMSRAFLLLLLAGLLLSAGLPPFLLSGGIALSYL